MWEKSVLGKCKDPVVGSSWCTCEEKRIKKLSKNLTGNGVGGDG